MGKSLEKDVTKIAAMLPVYWLVLFCGVNLLCLYTLKPMKSSILDTVTLTAYACTRSAFIFCPTTAELNRCSTFFRADFLKLGQFSLLSSSLSVALYIS